MVDKHNQTFFGQKTCIILSSNSKSDPWIYIRCIKKKKSGDWQKFSEGKVIKISLLEMFSIYAVLSGEKKIWNTFHSFTDRKTPISFAWDEYDEDLLWVSIDDYSRALSYPEIKLLKRLLDHLIDEKIEFGTTRNIAENSNQISIDSEFKISSFNKENKNYKIDTHSKISEKDDYYEKNNKIKSSTTSTTDRDSIVQIKARIKAKSEKAILLVLDSNQEVWCPKSIIINDYNEDLRSHQNFIIKKWFLEKKKAFLTN
ncbi:MAG: hypothetical protein ACTSRZ_21325 [Promethearchaeota archaeon]